jgi:hypothetical protein
MSGNNQMFSSIGTLHRANWPGRASLVIRHAERFPILSALNNHHVGLTEKGFADAVEFGRSLVGYQKLRLFYSPAKRCRETAQSIARGAGEAGIEIIAIEEAPDLSGSANILDVSCLKVADTMGQDFIRAWFSGRIDPRTIKELAKAAEDMSAPIVGRLLDQEAAGLLDINVSHDWNIMAMRENYLRLRHEDLGWLNYLDGLAFFPSGSAVGIAYGEHRAALPLNGNRGREFCKSIGDSMILD